MNIYLGGGGGVANEYLDLDKVENKYPGLHLLVNRYSGLRF
jgi:hypothetical protein